MEGNTDNGVFNKRDTLFRPGRIEAHQICDNQADLSMKDLILY